MKYVCRHCHQTVTRDSNKRWVKSYCTKTGKAVHLIRKETRKNTERP